MSKVKVTLVNYTDFIRVDVDRIDCGEIRTYGNSFILLDQIRDVLATIFDKMGIENVEVVKFDKKIK